MYRSDKALDVEQRTKTTSAYVFDTIELNEQWMVNLGLRYDANKGTDQGCATATIS